jgi:hypothetical protein
VNHPVVWLTGAAPGHGHLQDGTGARRCDDEEADMGMMRKLIASGVAAKVIQEAKKPENQAKLKKLISDFQNKSGGAGSGKGRGATH